jgi:dynein heavy chain
VVKRERLIYGDYLVPGAEPKVYAPATDLGQLSTLMETYLEDYNSTSTSPMKLVCFLDAIEHVSRICRWVRGWGEGMDCLGAEGGSTGANTALMLCSVHVILD